MSSAPPLNVVPNLRPARSEGWFYVPYEAIGNDAAIKAEKRRLTHKSPYQDKGELPIRMYKDMPQHGYLGMPRAYGMERYPWLAVDDRTTDGALMIDAASYNLPSPHHPAVKEPELQAKFMADLDRAFLEHKNFIAYATTGSGKTVCGARSAIIRGFRTAVFMPLERLMDMWWDTLTGPLFNIPEHRIGIVQSDRCEFEDRDFVLCMMKSLGGRRYHPDFYKSIGTVIPDECHRLGSPELAMITAQFAARVRCGLSATPERTDGSDKVLFWHIGPIKVRSEATAVECRVYVKDYDDGGRMAAIPPLIAKPGEKKKPDHGYRIKALTRDERRNRILAEMVFRLWRQGRKVLAIGEHVAHVQHIMELCQRMGIPADQMGQCTGERHETTLVKVVNGRPVYKKRKVKVTAEEFDRAKTQSAAVFATYGCFKEGIDEQRLDALVTLTPQAKDKQVRGRVRRPFAGKEFALYVSLRDTGDWMSMRYHRAKEREWAGDKTVKVFWNKI